MNFFLHFPWKFMLCCEIDDWLIGDWFSPHRVILAVASELFLLLRDLLPVSWLFQHLLQLWYVHLQEFNITSTQCLEIWHVLVVYFSIKNNILLHCIVNNMLIIEEKLIQMFKVLLCLFLSNACNTKINLLL